MRMGIHLKTCFVLTVLSIQAIFAAATEVHTLETGQKAPGFNLVGVDGQMHDLSEYDKSDVLAVLFTCNHCPTAQAYEQRMVDLVNDYKGKSVQLIAISGNDDKAVRLDELRFSDIGDSLEDMKYRAKDFGYNFPYLYDGDTQAATIAYGARATPHIFIFDKERKLRYQGRIDSNENPAKVTKTEARDAIDAILTGKEIEVVSTRAFGCSTKWSSKRESVKTDNEKWEALPVSLNPIKAEDVKALFAPSKNYRLVNVWATWCVPCIAKFPKLVEVNRMYQHRNFEFMSISLDAIEMESKVKSFLEKEHSAIPPKSVSKFKEDGFLTNNFIFEGDDREDFFKAFDPQWSGAIPYMIIISPEGEIVDRFESVVEISELRKALVGYLGRYFFKVPAKE